VTVARSLAGGLRVASRLRGGEGLADALPPKTCCVSSATALQYDASMNDGRRRVRVEGAGIWCLAVVMLAAGCSSGAGGPSDGGAGSGGAPSGAAGMGAGGNGTGGAGGAAGSLGSTGGTAGGAAGTGDPNVPAVTMSLWEYAIGPTTQLAPNIWMDNDSAKPFSMHDMEFRYWYTSDLGGAAGVTQSTVFQGSQGLGSEPNATIVPVVPARPMADTYLSLDFSPESASVDVGTAVNILVYVTRSDGGTYDQSNDYSYNGSASSLMVTDRITVYYKGALIYGTEP
jgi:hypothetical protein